MSGRVKSAAGFAAILGVLTMLAPAGASAGLLDDVGRGVNDTVRDVNDRVRDLTGGGGGGGGAAAPAPAPAVTGAPTQLDATTNPPLDGTNPHGQGTVFDLNTPLLEDDVVIGRARGEENLGQYHGKVTVVSALGLEAAIETNEGEEQHSPVTPVNDILADICTGSGNNVCLAVFDYDSETTENGSFNSFSAARADIGEGLVSAQALASEGNIAEDSQCQAATGHSEAANVSALGVVTATALESNSASVACRDGSKSSGANSEVMNLNGKPLLSKVVGCDNTQESVFVVNVGDLLPITIAQGVCNGDSTSQTVPFNVRKALQLDLLDVDVLLSGLSLLGGNGPLLNLNGASTESLAEAPEGPDPVCPDPNNPVCDENPPCANPPCADRDPDHRNRFVGFVRRPSATSPEGSLPFTGADLGVMLLIGAAAMGTGLGLMAVADRRRRRQLTPQ